jgi:hypothetical protein
MFFSLLPHSIKSETLAAQWRNDCDVDVVRENRGIKRCLSGSIIAACLNMHKKELKSVKTDPHTLYPRMIHRLPNGRPACNRRHCDGKGWSNDPEGDEQNTRSRLDIGRITPDRRLCNNRAEGEKHVYITAGTGSNCLSDAFIHAECHACFAIAAVLKIRGVPSKMFFTCFQKKGYSWNKSQV